MQKTILQDSAKNNIHVYIYEPAAKPYKGVVQIIHGASEHFARYGLFAEFLNKQGYVAVGADLLGHGLSTSTNDFVHFADKNGSDLALESVTLVKDLIAKNYPNLPVILLGHSMGSFLARLMIIKYPDFYQKAVISGTAHRTQGFEAFGIGMCNLIILLRGPRHISRLVNKMAIESCPARLRKDGIITGIDEEWLTKNVEIQNYYHDSPMCGQPFTVSANRDMSTWMKFVDNLANINAGNKAMPLYFMSGSQDPVSNYGKEVTELVNVFKQVGYQNVSMKLYDSDRHEVLNELDKETAYQDILNFIKK
jgi:alpha-beta hydrolase superfamily lysophospholipase